MGKQNNLILKKALTAILIGFVSAVAIFMILEHTNTGAFRYGASSRIGLPIIHSKTTLTKSLGPATEKTDPHHPKFEPKEFHFENYFPNRERYITKLYLTVGEICRRHPYIGQLDEIFVDNAGAQKYVDPVSNPIQYVYLYPPLPNGVDPKSPDAKKFEKQIKESSLLQFDDDTFSSIEIQVGVSSTDSGAVVTCYVNKHAVYVWDKDIHPNFDSYPHK